MLINIYWIIPEIYLILNLNILLIIYLIYSKLNKKNVQQIKFIWLSVYLFLLTSILYIEQINISEIIYISNNILFVTPLINCIKIIICWTTLIILLASKKYYLIKEIQNFEFLLLIIIATLGMLLLLNANNLIFFYLSLELFSLALYILATLYRQNELSTEAGLKYFVLGSLSSGLLLFGIAIIYTFTGELNIDSIGYILWYNQNSYIILGISFILISILFKLAAAPFHMWAPDVYEGAPTIVTMFFATIPKITILGILINFIWFSFFGVYSNIQNILIFSSVLSLLIGSIGALNQTKIKRLIAYSAITHIGFILLGFISGTVYSAQIILLYILIYLIMSIATFICIIIIFNKTNYITELSGLSRKNNILALTFAIILFSTAGIPPLAGFFSKYLILLEAISNNFLILSIIAILASAIAAFYYIRLIKWMFFKDSSDFYYKDLNDIIKPTFNITLFNSLILGILLFMILTILFFPNYIIHFLFEILITSLL